MNFDETVNSLVPKLRQLALRYKSLYAFIDEDDLLNEMLLFLVREWRRGALENKTGSYIVQACYFHLRNYLRTAGADHRYVSLDVSLNEMRAGRRGDAERSPGLEEVIADSTPSMQAYTEGKALYETIMHNGFKKIEKKIIRYLVDGMTVREIGKKLHISHAMVVKYKKGITGKVTKKYANLLV